MKKEPASTIPKFFCENCGNEVKRNTKVCPHCGRFFASVKCPNCGFAGDSEHFSVGCPKCGYAVNSDLNTKKNNNKGKSKKNKVNSSYKENRYDDLLPWWVYSLVAGLLVILITYMVLQG